MHSVMLHTMQLHLPALTVDNSHELADEAYAMLKRKVLSWRQKDEVFIITVVNAFISVLRL